jgi:hypothetical protein
MGQVTSIAMLMMTLTTKRMMTALRYDLLIALRRSKNDDEFLCCGPTLLFTGCGFCAPVQELVRHKWFIYF